MRRTVARVRGKTARRGTRARRRKGGDGRLNRREVGSLRDWGERGGEREEDEVEEVGEEGCGKEIREWDLEYMVGECRAMCCFAPLARGRKVKRGWKLKTGAWVGVTAP